MIHVCLGIQIKVIMKMKKDGGDEYVVDDEMEIYDDGMGMLENVNGGRSESDVLCRD